jgi:hypothetical protein
MRRYVAEGTPKSICLPRGEMRRVRRYRVGSAAVVLIELEEIVVVGLPSMSSAYA